FSSADSFFAFFIGHYESSSGCEREANSRLDGWLRMATRYRWGTDASDKNLPVFGQALSVATSLSNASWFPSGSVNSANHNSDFAVRFTTCGSATKCTFLSLRVLCTA